MNLNTATNEQLEEYRQKTASILHIDPLMLDFIWMNDPESGLKNRVLYAKRGAAEVLRQNLNISVLSMEHHESNGWLMFTAIGKDGKGRQEIAHGAAYIEGLKADKKAHSVMTASTRALRRLTLQFVAGGILDETEVQAQSALQDAPAASQAQPAGSLVVIPAPQVPISVQPGKDITPSGIIDVTNKEMATIVSGTSIEVVLAKRVDQKTNIAQVYEEGAKALADMKPATERPIQSLNDSNTALSAAETPEPKKKRKYTRRNQVDLASPGQPIQTEMPVGQIDANGKITPVPETGTLVPNPGTLISVPLTAKEPEQVAVGNGALVMPALAEPPIDAVAEHIKGSITIAEIAAAVLSPPKETTSLSPEKAKEYRDRLNKYSSDILPKAGMTPTENIGGCTMKLARFATLHTGTERSKLSEEQFEDVLGFLDTYSQQNGASALVQYIDKVIGAVK